MKTIQIFNYEFGVRNTKDYGVTLWNSVYNLPFGIMFGDKLSKDNEVLFVDIMESYQKTKSLEDFIKTHSPETWALWTLTEGKE